MLPQPVCRNLPRRGEHCQRDREVVAGALLPQRRRREVHGDALVRPLERRGRDAAPDAVLRLLARPICETDDREAGNPALEVRLYLDTARFEPDQRMREGASDHASTLRGERARV